MHVALYIRWHNKRSNDALISERNIQLKYSIALHPFTRCTAFAHFRKCWLSFMPNAKCSVYAQLNSCFFIYFIRWLKARFYLVQHLLHLQHSQCRQKAIDIETHNRKRNSDCEQLGWIHWAPGYPIVCWMLLPLLLLLQFSCMPPNREIVESPEIDSVFYSLRIFEKQ